MPRLLRDRDYRREMREPFVPADRETIAVAHVDVFDLRFTRLVT